MLQKQVTFHLELELQLVESLHVRAGIQTWTLWKSTFSHPFILCGWALKDRQ